ncbi:MAG: hypothetical protein ABSE42_17745 [Bryobacteraceae bacterium]
MKRIPLLVSLLVAVMSSRPAVVKAQAGQPISLIEPDTAEVFYGLKDDKLMPLERQTAATLFKTSGFLVMNMKSVWEFAGGKSPVRFHSGEPLEFVVRSELAWSDLDPNIRYALRHLDEKKKQRELVIMTGHSGLTGFSTQTNTAQGVLPVEFSKYGDNSIKLHSGPLPAGEYAISCMRHQTAFCFGVD